MSDVSLTHLPHRIADLVPAPPPLPKGQKRPPLWLLILVCTLLYVVLLPDENDFPYHYAPGKAWEYPSLKAPYDFDVLRVVNDQAGEISRINALKRPCFMFDDNRVMRSEKTFAEAVREQVRISRSDAQFEDLVNNHGIYTQTGERLLEMVYRKGVIEWPDNMTLTDTVVVFRAGRFSEVDADSLLLLQSALGYLTDSLPFMPLRQPELILPHLEQALTTNVIYSDSLTRAYLNDRKNALFKTGVRVRQGDLIVEKGQVIDQSTFEKLSTLAGKNNGDAEVSRYIGFGLAGFLIFFFFWVWLRLEHPEVWRIEQGLLKITLAVMLPSALFLLLLRWGAAPTFMLPVYIAPLLLRRQFGRMPGVAVWLTVMALTALTVSWGVGWIMLQSAALLGLGALDARVINEKQRFVSIAAVTALEVAVWGTMIPTRQIPPVLQVTDVPVFIVLSGVITFMVSVLMRLRMQ